MIPSGSLSDKINQVRQAVVSLEFASDFINDTNNKVNLTPFTRRTARNEINEATPHHMLTTASSITDILPLSPS